MVAGLSKPQKLTKNVLTKKGIRNRNVGTHALYDNTFTFSVCFCLNWHAYV
jgi:hypothetical protein